MRFARCAIALRRAHPALRLADEALVESGWFPRLTWHGTRAWDADWSPLNRLVAVMFYRGDGNGHDCVYLAANAYWEPLTVELPALPDGAAWHLAADTHAASPEDIAEPGHEPPLDDQRTLVVRERSVVALTTHTAR